MKDSSILIWSYSYKVLSMFDFYVKLSSKKEVEMKKSLFISFLSVLLLIAVFAVAESIDFEPAGFKIDVSEKEYTNIVTKDNIESHKEFLSENGFKEEELKYLFDNSGLLLRAYNLKDKRVFSVYAKRIARLSSFLILTSKRARRGLHTGACTARAASRRTRAISTTT